MTILHLSASDSGGGAFIATYRLHSGLRKINVDSRMIVQKKETENNYIYGPKNSTGKVYNALRRKINEVPVKYYTDRDSEIFSPAWLPEYRINRIKKYDPEIINLHWIANGFLKPSTISELNAPIVWTLHDMWPFTGGCHYAKECKRYKTKCGNCPHLRSHNSRDLAWLTWKQKYQQWKDIEFTVVSPSKWLADQASESPIFSDADIRIIPNGLDIDEFRPRQTNKVKETLGINSETQIICFGADSDSPRKGTDLIFEALDRLNTEETEVQAIIFGNIKKEKIPAVDIPIHTLGFVKKRVLQRIYSEANAMIVPSRQEAFGQTASEALASGTPVVAFNTTGLKDIIDNKETGYLADPFDVGDLADGIRWVISNNARNTHLGKQARKVAKDRFSIKRVAKMYEDLYTSLK